MEFIRKESIEESLEDATEEEFLGYIGFGKIGKNRYRLPGGYWTDKEGWEVFKNFLKQIKWKN